MYVIVLKYLADLEAPGRLVREMKNQKEENASPGPKEHYSSVFFV
jgi:hypothetical protein